MILVKQKNKRLHYEENNKQKAISECLDNLLEKENKTSLTPPEANEVLAKAGLLNDNVDRAGLPLRKLLRNNQLPQAYQLGGKYSRWVIPHSKMGI